MSWKNEVKIEDETEKIAPVEVKNEVPLDYSSCYEWFDGCNYCRVFNGFLLDCTK